MCTRNPHERYVNFYTDFAFKKLFGTEVNKEPSFTPAELSSYRESQKDFWDFNACVETAEDRGRKEGEAIGLEKGRAEGEAIGMQKGRAEGEAIGMQKGEAKGRAERDTELASIMRSQGYSEEQIAVLFATSAH